MHTGQTQDRLQDLESGATEVVSDTVESALQFASLLGASKSQLEATKLRKAAQSESQSMAIIQTELEDAVPGISEDTLLDLMEELGCVRKDILESWSVF